MAKNNFKKIAFPIVLGVLVTLMGTIFALAMSWNSSDHNVLKENDSRIERKVDANTKCVEMLSEKMKLQAEKTQVEVDRKSQIQMEILLEIKQDLGELKGQLRGL